MVLPGEPIILRYASIILIEITNKSHEVVPSNCKGGSLAPQLWLVEPTWLTRAYMSELIIKVNG